jgi:hypothetical protein
VISQAFVVLLLAATVASGPVPQNPPEGKASADQYVGTWSGQWDSSGSGGGFELTIEKGQDGALAGRVSVTGEPTYKATLKKLAFDGNKMTGAYDFTPNTEAEVLLTATFEGNTAKGTWSLRAKADGTEVATGGWNVARK